VATEHGILDLSYPAATDLSSHQFKPVTMRSDGAINTISSTLTSIIGILQDDPDAAGRACAVRLAGESKMIVDGSTNGIYPGYKLGVNASGVGVMTTTANQEIIAVALEQSIAANDIISVLVIPGGARY
jgi:hypothetical protein